MNLAAHLPAARHSEATTATDEPAVAFEEPVEEVEEEWQREMGLQRIPKRSDGPKAYALADRCAAMADKMISPWPGGPTGIPSAIRPSGTIRGSLGAEESTHEASQRLPIRQPQARDVDVVVTHHEGPGCTCRLAFEGRDCLHVECSEILQPNQDIQDFNIKDILVDLD